MIVSSNDIMLDLVHGHAIDLARVEEGLRKSYLEQLQALEADLVSQLASIDPTGPGRASYKTQRLEALLKQSRETIKSAYKKIDKGSVLNLADIAEGSGYFGVSSLNASIGIDIASVAISAELASAIASDTMIQGAASSEWWAGQSGSLQDAFTKSMRDGMVKGETLADLIKRIRGTAANGFKDGLMNKSRREAEALARSSVQAVSNSALDATWDKNADLIKAVRWTSTLDKRTSDFCKVRDGKLYSVQGHTPVGHSYSWAAGPGASHWGCRSASVPVIKSWADLTGKDVKVNGKKFQDIFEQRLKARGFDSVQAEEALTKARASMGGPVPQDITYEGWLKARNKASNGFAASIMGKKRAELWLSGRLSFDEAINQKGRGITSGVYKGKALDVLEATQG